MGSARDRIVSAACRALAVAFRPSGEMGLSAPRRILVIKPGSLGDVLLAGPALASLRAGFPDARIWHLVAGWARPAAAGSPYVDGLIDCGSVGIPGNYTLRQYVRTANRIRARRFDAAIVLDRSPLMALLPWLAGIGVRVGLDSGGRGFALNYRAPIRPARGESELYLDAIRRIGLPVVRPETWYCPPSAATAKVRGLLAAGNRPPGYLVLAPGGGVNPGARRADKRWAPGGFIRVAERLGDVAGLLPVLVGDANDQDAVDAVRSGLAAGPVIDLSGELCFAEVGALLALADGFVANDSAIAHLGAAVGSSGVIVYTVTDPEIYGPPGGKVVKLVAAPGCDVEGAAVAALTQGINRAAPGPDPGRATFL
jgi:ADP-heptose:LPS heptosyltransferase